MIYQEDDFLQLAGLQHFAFCRRQWALIHIEQQWVENLLTIQGNILHEKAHDSKVHEFRGGLLVVRGMKIHSSTLGVSGACDVVEFYQSDNGITLPDREGSWQPYPVEYKRGSPKITDADRLQLCAQGMCIEEMLCCDVPEGAIFYGETRRREAVMFTSELRDKVRDYLEEMHMLYRRKYTPKVKSSKNCKSCSLSDLCLPKLSKKQSVRNYLKTRLEESI